MQAFHFLIQTGRTLAIQPVGDEQYDGALPEHAPSPVPVEELQRLADTRTARPISDGIGARISGDPHGYTAALFLRIMAVSHGKRHPKVEVSLESASDALPVMQELARQAGQSCHMAVVSGAVTSGLGYALWYAVLPVLGAGRAAVAQLSVPVLAALGGAEMTW